MSSTASLERAPALCNSCGIPFDSQYFDASNIEAAPANVGEEVVLARFDLPPQYCGVLQYFSQFTDKFGTSAANIETPEIEWKVLINNHSLFPYLNLRHIVNPWGYGSFPLNIRLDESSSLELVARRVKNATDVEVVEPVTRVGGRVMGRFWYNPCYGDVERRNY